MTQVEDGRRSETDPIGPWRKVARALSSANHKAWLAFDQSTGVRIVGLNWKGRIVERAMAMRAHPRAVARLVFGSGVRERRRRARLKAAAFSADRFLVEFVEKHGRCPRILHVGNIANNAYLNAKFLNEAGYDCDVICYDYYHVMASPEWEDADFAGNVNDQLRPDWTSVNLGGFARPAWFAQGPQRLCIEYLVARRRGDHVLAQGLWRELGRANGTLPKATVQERLVDWANARYRRLAALPIFGEASALWASLENFGLRHGRLGRLAAAVTAPFAMFVQVAWESVFGRDPAGRAIDRPSGMALAAQFAAAFPGRTDPLVSADWIPYSTVLDRWADLFKHYDIVQTYSTDVAYPLLTGFRPYVGFEHGTLRAFTMDDSPTCRLTALGYRHANHVLITNGDCLEYAQRLGIETYTPMLHPIDEKRIAAIPSVREEMLQRYGVKHLFLCPLRHDWVVKGTDNYIRALPALATRIGRDFRVIMTRWGAQLDDSLALADSLGVADLIEWLEPMNRRELIQVQKSVDVVFDQIALPHFGATAPQAIAAGVPVIMSYDPKSTEWIISEPAPILPAWTPEDVVAAVVTALDPGWRRQFEVQAAKWYGEHHSRAAVIRRLSATYRTVSVETGIL